MNGNCNFISNNVKAIKASEKRLKLFEYLRNNINNNVFFFKKHVHRQMANKNGKTILRVLYFSHGKSNSCGVAIGYCRTETFKVVNTGCTKN